MSSLTLVVLVTLAAGCATGLGALPTLVTDRVSHRVYDGALGFAAGVMVGAAMFALVVPGLELGTPLEVVVGIGLGAGFLLVTNALLPHLHLRFRGGQLEGTAALETEADDGAAPATADDRRRALLVAAR